MNMKPILFNTPMVCAILEDHKTVTRRTVKGYALDHLELDTDGSIIGVYNQDEGHVFPVMDYAPYHPGDILYVRETWAPLYPDLHSNNVVGYIYKADPLSVENYDKRFPGGKDYQWEGRWRPSIHMPRKAARIFLRVTDVRVERLQDMQPYDIAFEGFRRQRDFKALWDNTLKPKDRALYGWDANPWVWVIEFERCEKPRGAGHGLQRID